MLPSLARAVTVRAHKAPLSPLAAVAEAISNGSFRPLRVQRAQSTASESVAQAPVAATVKTPFYNSGIPLSKRERQVFGKVSQQESKPLRSVAEHGYLYGFTEAELVGCNELIKRALSTRTADTEQAQRFRKEQLLKRLGDNDADSGNSRVQVAMLTEKINRLSAHQSVNKHDKGVGRSLQILSSRRRKLLQYMQRTDFDGYRLVVKDLGLRPVPIINPRHPPKTRAETHKQINERNKRLKNRTSRGSRGH